MIQSVLEELGFAVKTPCVLNVDNNSSVMTYGSEVAEWRSPTLGAKYYHTRDYVDNGEIVIVHIDGETNPADIHTKPLVSEAHHRHAQWLGLYDAGGDSAGE